MIDIHSHIVFGVDDGPKSKQKARFFWQKSMDKKYGFKM